MQHLKKEMSDEVDCLHADKHQSFLQVDTIFFDGFGQACPKYSNKFAVPLQYFKKEVRNTLSFCMCIDLLPLGNNLLYMPTKH